MSRLCGAIGPREATSPCIMPEDHDGIFLHQDDAGGVWVVTRFSSEFSRLKMIECEDENGTPGDAGCSEWGDCKAAGICILAEAMRKLNPETSA